MEETNIRNREDLSLIRGRATMVQFLHCLARKMNGLKAKNFNYYLRGSTNLKDKKQFPGLGISAIDSKKRRWGFTGVDIGVLDLIEMGSELAILAFSPLNLQSSLSANVYSPGRNSIFAIGPYAHETRLVSPPVFNLHHRTIHRPFTPLRNLCIDNTFANWRFSTRNQGHIKVRSITPDPVTPPFGAISIRESDFEVMRLANSDNGSQNDDIVIGHAGYRFELTAKVGTNRMGMDHPHRVESTAGASIRRNNSASYK
ncbi:hypothetical protein IFM89_010551 [Coptis chinensis]|uniref:Uncharacterized protein n=1 Tax=Coptis chinensis TaxID=261450 RepID=A0A835MES1_9MAGN|nr:hypothetical protein IFM89_010551 [Coptis chinensis]